MYINFVIVFNYNFLSIEDLLIQRLFEMEENCDIISQIDLFDNSFEHIKDKEYLADKQLISKLVLAKSERINYVQIKGKILN